MTIKCPCYVDPHLYDSIRDADDQLVAIAAGRKRSEQVARAAEIVAALNERAERAAEREKAKAKP
jgi:hypothetical protein